jgi:nitrite reductase/ring-hydroxylating ferredoxin subunit
VSAGRVLAARRSSLPPGSLCRFLVDDAVRVLVCTERGELRALDGICTHEHAELADGDIEDDTLWCPFHAAGFDVHTGRATCPPAVVGLRTYAVSTIGDEIYVDREPA